MKGFAIIEKGIGKPVSEDRVLLGDTICECGSTWLDFSSDQILIALADGVGGNAGGAEAAQFVLEQLHVGFRELHNLSENGINTMLIDVNERLIDFAADISSMKNMATTLTGLIADGRAAYSFHIGNTRLYTVQGSYLRQRTVDHTTKEWLRRMGQHEAATNCPNNEITACLGGGMPDLIKALQITPIDGWSQIRGWVLTTDGIHDYVDDGEIDLLSCDIMQAEDFCKHVIQDAIDNGSDDDKSIIVIRRED